MAWDKLPSAGSVGGGGGGRRRVYGYGAMCVCNLGWVGGAHDAAAHDG